MPQQINIWCFKHHKLIHSFIHSYMFFDLHNSKIFSFRKLAIYFDIRSWLQHNSFHSRSIIQSLDTVSGPKTIWLKVGTHNLITHNLNFDILFQNNLFMSNKNCLFFFLFLTFQHNGMLQLSHGIVFVLLLDFPPLLATWGGLPFQCY